MANENMTMDEAIDKAVDMATTKGTGEPVVEDTPAEETPQDAPETTETPAEKPEAQAEAKPEEEQSPTDLAAQLADLTHDDVVHTKAGKGLVAELQREREKRHAAEAEIETLKAGKPKADEVEAEEAPADDPLAGLADDDLVEVGHFRKAVAAEVAKAFKPVAERFTRTDRTERQQVMATGLAALAAEQKAGNIPAGVNTSSIVNKAVETLKASRPALLQELLSEPDPVRAVWEYATARMPAAKQALAQAVKAKAGVTAERLAKGQSPDTGDEPENISNLIADLNSP